MVGLAVGPSLQHRGLPAPGTPRAARCRQEAWRRGGERGARRRPHPVRDPAGPAALVRPPSPWEGRRPAPRGPGDPGKFAGEMHCHPAARRGGEKKMSGDDGRQDSPMFLPQSEDRQGEAKGSGAGGAAQRRRRPPSTSASPAAREGPAGGGRRGGAAAAAAGGAAAAGTSGGGRGGAGRGGRAQPAAGAAASERASERAGGRAGGLARRRRAVLRSALPTRGRAPRPLRRAPRPLRRACSVRPVLPPAHGRRGLARRGLCVYRPERYSSVAVARGAEAGLRSPGCWDGASREEVSARSVPGSARPRRACAGWRSRRT